MDAPAWPAAPAPGPARRAGVPGWLKACGVGLVGLVVGAGLGGTEAEPVDAEVVRVTATETETERAVERVTVTEPAPTVTVTEPAPTVTVTEVAAAPQPFVEPAPAPAPAPAPQPAPAPAPPPPSSTAYYDNCDAARAAGAAPLYTGDPGYRAGLDRDSDGVACE